MAALDTAEGLDPEFLDRLRSPLRVLHLERHVMEAGPALLKEPMQVARLVIRFEDLEMAGAAGDAQTDAAEPHIRALEAAFDGHSHQLR